MIVKKNPEQFQGYLEDTSNMIGRADILYIPENKEEIRDIVMDCNRRKIPLTCSSARTGTTGGCVPLEGGLVSLENLDRVIDIDTEDKIVTVGAGLPLCELEEALNRNNLTLRAQPTESLAFVGAAASTCASGVRGFRYGSIRNYVRRLEVILADGTVLNIRRGEFISRKRKFSFSLSGKNFKFDLPSYIIPSVKSQAGYFVKNDMELIDLFIGSEGTLGIITELELAVQPLAESIFDAVVFFGKEREGLNFVDTVKKLKKNNAIDPASLEYLDANSLAFLKGSYPSMPLSGSAVYFEQETDAGEADKKLHEWAEIIESSGGNLDNVWLGDSEKERKKINEFRHRLPEMINEFLREQRQTKTATDIAVPDHCFHEMYRFYRERALECGIHYVNFGHIGENHLHFNFLPENDEEHRKAKQTMSDFVKRAVHLGGTVSAEHGIGKIKKPYLEIMYGPKHIREMAALKKCFDKGCILGLDNIFDKKLL